MSKTLVIGTGISGISAVNLLSAKGIQTVLFDGNDKLEISEIYAKLDRPEDTSVYVGFLPKEAIDAIDSVVLSPGVPIDSPMVTELESMGKTILGEVELAYTYDRGKVLAITGTNGKTTTTSLLGKIMQDETHNAFVVGNIGNPYTEAVLSTTKDSITVAEISSFQLETIRTFAPKVSAILNITPDHLNRHHTMEKYIEEKEKITRFQNKDDYVILNHADSILKCFGEELIRNGNGPKTIFFDVTQELEEGLFLRGDIIMIRLNGEERELLKIGDMQIIGMHNVENAMAAIGMAYVYGVPAEHIVKSVKEFKAVPHRIEFIAEKKGVRYYNDSKGTNVDAAIKGINAMDRPTYLIGGGYDKGSTYDEWIEAFGGKVKKLILIGQTKEKIAACAGRHGFNDYLYAQSLEEAVGLCSSLAEEGEAVLLSPACASWGMFKNYEERGDIFRELVEKL